LRLGAAALALVLPADCLLCGRPLPWEQRGGVCLPCWADLPWAPGVRTRRGALRAVLWAADYDGPFRRLVQALKFEGIDYLARHLGSEAALRLAFALSRADIVVPVPLHWWRRYARGYNQALLLARALAQQAGLPLLPRALARRRVGRRQLGLSRAERLRALEGCYAPRAPWTPRSGGRSCAVAGRTVLLVDDVVTTGATLEACARALRRAGAREVVGCVLARTPSRGSVGRRDARD
jgi:ComF family protein